MFNPNSTTTFNYCTEMCDSNDYHYGDDDVTETEADCTEMYEAERQHVIAQQKIEAMSPDEWAEHIVRLGEFLDSLGPDEELPF